MTRRPSLFEVLWWTYVAAILTWITVLIIQNFA